MRTPDVPRSRRPARPRGLFPLALLAALGAGPGCGSRALPPPPAPAVTVVQAVERTVPVYLDYIGSTESVRSVDIRARVEGFLETRSFVEGDEVKTGEVVYVIDRRPFEAALAKSLGQLARDQAQVDFARLQMERYRVLADRDFVARQTCDDWATQYAQALAAVEADQAQVAEDRLNLSWCTMASPLDGRIGITYVHVGNLVGAGEDTRLATIVQLDPIYVYFSPSVSDLETIRARSDRKDPPVKIVLPGGTAHPHDGRLDFVNNQADKPTSTVMLRAVVPNPEKTLLPGQFVTARLFVTNAPGVVLVPKQAVCEDQRGSYVYVVDAQSQVQYRPVVATYEHEKYRVVEKGLQKGERVVVDGQQKVRPGMSVRAETDPQEEPQAPGAAGGTPGAQDAMPPPRPG